MTREEYELTEKEVGIQVYRSISNVSGILMFVLFGFVILFGIVNPFVGGYYIVNTIRCLMVGLIASYIHIKSSKRYKKEKDTLYQYLINLKKDKAY